jgi:DNA-binding transcriptional ArsR family regulator
MGRLLPLRGEPESPPDGPRVLSLDEEASAEALSALSSETARRLLQALYEQPRTAPELREEVGTSLQNVHYHLERLESADLIEPTATGYSEKGTEMSVYAPKNEALVLFAGEEQTRSRLRETLSRLLGGIGVLAFGTLALRALLDRFGPTAAGGAEEEAGGAGETAAGTPTESDGSTPTAVEQSTPVADREATGTEDAVVLGDDAATEEVARPTADAGAEALTETTREVADTAGDVTTAASGAPDPTFALDPVVAFFLGGLFMLTVVAVWLHWRR